MSELLELLLQSLSCFGDAWFPPRGEKRRAGCLIGQCGGSRDCVRHRGRGVHALIRRPR